MPSHRHDRLLRLAAEVKTNPWQTVSGLCRTLGIAKAQLYRDKHALAASGFVFNYSRVQSRFLIEKDPYLPIYDLTLTETFALTMAVRQLSAAGDFILTYGAVEALKKIVANAPSTRRELLVSCLHDTVLRQGFGCQPQVLDDLHKALLEQRRVVITYTSPTDDAPKAHTLDPYQIYFKRRALYLDAYSPEAGAYRVFRVNRITEVRSTGMGFTRHTDYNFAQRHRHSFSVFVGDTVQRVRVRFAKRIAPLIRETCWHHSQQLKEEPNGSLLFEVEVSEPREVGWWVLQWGSEAEVLEPESLRQELYETAQRLAALYGRTQRHGRAKL
ncbi:MAG: helix-turn-helix transcriptional regulator [Candidatus Binatia bacterium]